MGLDPVLVIRIDFDAAAGYLESIADHLDHLGGHSTFSEPQPLRDRLLRFAFSDGSVVEIAPLHAVNDDVITCEISPRMPWFSTNVALWCADQEPLVQDIARAAGYQPNTRDYAGVHQRALAHVGLSVGASGERLRIGFIGASEQLCAHVVGSRYLRRLLVDAARWFDPGASAEVEINGTYVDVFDPHQELPAVFLNHHLHARTLRPDGAMHEFVIRGLAGPIRDSG